MEKCKKYIFKIEKWKAIDYKENLKDYLFYLNKEFSYKFATNYFFSSFAIFNVDLLNNEKINYDQIFMDEIVSFTDTMDEAKNILKKIKEEYQNYLKENPDTHFVFEFDE